MSRLEPWVLAFIPDGDQFLFQQGHHIILVFLRGQTEKDSADMGSHSEIDFVFMFCPMFLQYCVVYHCLGYVIRKEPCPYFLFNVFGFICMKITQPNGMFQFPE